MSEIVLYYIGGGAYYPGVPACDMTQEMLDACGMTAEQLVKSGLYKRPTVKPPAKPGKEK